MDRQRFNELLARARAISEAAKQEAEVTAADQLKTAMDNHPVISIDLSQAGISDHVIKTPEGEETAVEVIKDVIKNIAETPEQLEGSTKRVIGVARDDITLNAKQLEFNNRVQDGEDVVLIGAAGTGKTTSMRTVTKDLIASGRIKPLTIGTKWLQVNKPGAAILSFTNKAVNNIRHAVADELKSHTLTIHKLLEFQPVFYEIEDPNEPGSFKKTMRFEPTRNSSNPLPSELKFIAFEESSMISLELYELLQDALPHDHQEVFLGDIQQLPPVMGLAVLGFKLVELPVVELTEIYRQALESPIVNLAWKILEGNPHDFSGRKENYTTYSDVLHREVSRIRCPVLDKYTRETDQGKVFFQVWQKRLSADLACSTFIKQVNTWADQGYYNPEDDIILCPFNKAFGTIEINKGIMQHLGKKRDAVVHEIIAGYNKYYLAVGDRVLYDKEDAVIISINRNGKYFGKRPTAPSKFLDRWGAMQEHDILQEEAEIEANVLEDQDFNVDALEDFMSGAIDEAEDRVNAASHTVTIKFAYSDETTELDSASEINNLLGGYAITIHKSQGSEWEKVFLVLHDSHSVMVSRELLYTGITRAKKFLHIIAETNTFEKGIKSQRIKGNTIQEKAVFFRGEASKRDKELNVEGKFKPSHHLISGKVAIKVEDLCPVERKLEILAQLKTYWMQAQHRWPQIGECPNLSFDLRRKNCLGLAQLTRNTIKINPIWAACTDTEVKAEMDTITIVHEICHHVVWRLHKNNTHGLHWQMAMKAMGFTPDRLYTGNALPPWAEKKKELLTEVFAKISDQQETELEEGDLE